MITAHRSPINRLIIMNINSRVTPASELRKDELRGRTGSMWRLAAVMSEIIDHVDASSAIARNVSIRRRLAARHSLAEPAEETRLASGSSSSATCGPTARVTRLRRADGVARRRMARWAV